MAETAIRAESRSAVSAKESESSSEKAGILQNPVWIPDCVTGDMDRNLKLRTKALASEVINIARELPRDSMTELLTVQLVRAGTSAGANYRAACRAKSRADFIAKMTTTEEEMDETSFWLEVLVESGAISRDRARPLLDEANQLTAIVVSSARTAKANRR